MQRQGMKNRKQPLVSICIPTYNRAWLLRNTLDSIVAQPEFGNKTVEVVISDNASTDETETVAKAYAGKYDNVKYFRNAVNVRDENFPLALSRARGVLRKLNNDTVLLKPDALGKLCALAEKYREERPCIFLSNGNHGGVEERILNFRDFAVLEGFRITWLASFTIWDDACENIHQDLDGCQLSLWQVRKFYENASKKDAVVVWDTVFGEGQSVPNKDISYGLYHVFYENYMSILNPYVLSGALRSEDVEKIEKDLLYHFFADWIARWEINRSQYQYSETENLKACVTRQYEKKSYWQDYEKYYKKRLLIARIKKAAFKILRRKK